MINIVLIIFLIGCELLMGPAPIMVKLEKMALGFDPLGLLKDGSLPKFHSFNSKFLLFHFFLLEIQLEISF